MFLNILNILRMDFLNKRVLSLLSLEAPQIRLICFDPFLEFAKELYRDLWIYRPCTLDLHVQILRDLGSVNLQTLQCTQRSLEYSTCNDFRVIKNHSHQWHGMCDFIIAVTTLNTVIPWNDQPKYQAPFQNFYSA